MFVVTVQASVQVPCLQTALPTRAALQLESVGMARQEWPIRRLRSCQTRCHCAVQILFCAGQEGSVRELGINLFHESSFARQRAEGTGHLQGMACCLLCLGKAGISPAGGQITPRLVRTFLQGVFTCSDESFSQALSVLLPWRHWLPVFVPARLPVQQRTCHLPNQP